MGKAGVEKISRGKGTRPAFPPSDHRHLEAAHGQPGGWEMYGDFNMRTRNRGWKGVALVMNELEQAGVENPGRIRDWPLHNSQ